MPSGGSADWPCAHQTAIPSRHDADRRREHPDRRRPERVAGRLEPDVPGDVEHGREATSAMTRVPRPDVTCPCRVAEAERAEGQAADRQDGRDDDTDRVEEPAIGWPRCL